MRGGSSREGRRLRVRRVGHDVVVRPVLRQQLRIRPARVMGVREAEVDQERVLVRGLLALLEVAQNLVCVPSAAVFIGRLALGGVAHDGELLVGGLVAVALLTGPHGVVARAVEDGRHRVLGQVFGAERIGASALHAVAGQVPDRAAGHDHVPRRGADRARPRTHVIGPVQSHSTGCDARDDGGPERRARVVGLEVEGGLIVGEDEQDVGALGGGGVLQRLGGGAGEQEQERQAGHGWGPQERQ